MVHLPAADLLRRHQAHAQRAAARDLARRRRAGDRADPHRLDGDRRVRRPLRLFLHRLLLRAAHLRASPTACRRGRRRRSAASRCGRIVNGVLVFTGYADLPFVSLALGLLGAGAVVAVAALMAQERSVPAAALLRRATRSSSISPSSCRWRRPASCCSRPASSPTSAPISLLVTLAGVIGALVLVLGGARHAVPLPVRAAGLGAARAARGRRRCSRRNDSQTALSALIQAGRRPTFGPCQHPPKPSLQAEAPAAAPRRRVPAR